MIHILYIVLGFLGLIMIVILDKFYWYSSILREGNPSFLFADILRSVIIFISVLSIIWSLSKNTKQHYIWEKRNYTIFEPLSIVIPLSLAILFLFIFIFKTYLFNALSMEDNIIEWGSAILLFASSTVLSITLLKTLKTYTISIFIKLTLLFLSIIFFIIAMEEISWFQRVLEIDTPKAFANNMQLEMNLHNFATDITENIYYFGAFVFLVVLPFLRYLFPLFSKKQYMYIFIPSPFIAIVGIISCGYNYDMWHIIFTQIAFFSSIIILYFFTILSQSQKEKYICIFTIILIICTQIIFLTHGVNFERLWEVTEYKEFFIPVGFFIYSLDVSRHLFQED